MASAIKILLAGIDKRDSTALLWKKKKAAGSVGSGQPAQTRRLPAHSPPGSGSEAKAHTAWPGPETGLPSRFSPGHVAAPGDTRARQPTRRPGLRSRLCQMLQIGRVCSCCVTRFDTKSLSALHVWEHGGVLGLTRITRVTAVRSPAVSPVRGEGREGRRARTWRSNRRSREAGHPRAACGRTGPGVFGCGDSLGRSSGFTGGEQHLSATPRFLAGALCPARPCLPLGGQAPRLGRPPFHPGPRLRLGRLGLN